MIKFKPKFLSLHVLVLVSFSLNSCSINLTDLFLFYDFDVIFSDPVNNNLNDVFENYNIKIDDFTIKSSDTKIIDDALNVYRSALDLKVSLTITHYTGEKKVYDVIIPKVDEGYNQDLEIYFLYVGQGDAIFIKLPNGENMIIDAGNSKYGGENSLHTITEMLSILNIFEINYFIVTHPHSDHDGHVESILDNYIVERLYLAKTFNEIKVDQYKGSSKNRNLEILFPNQGDYIFDYQGLNMIVLSALESVSLNESSIITRLQYMDFSVLFTGDGGKTRNGAEESSIKSGIRLDSLVLKVGHHGINDSSGEDFINLVNPKISVITSIRNKSTQFIYEDTAIRNIRNTGSDIYETGRLNHIVINTDGHIYYLYSIDGNGNQLLNPEPFNYY